MNNKYGLTKDNAYPNDLNIVSIKLEDIKEVNRIVVPRFAIGARWFDDIVNNNEVLEMVLKKYPKASFQYSNDKYLIFKTNSNFKNNKFLVLKNEELFEQKILFHQ